MKAGNLMMLALLFVMLSSGTVFATQLIGFYDPVDYPAGYIPLYAAVGDFNGDGLVDVVSLNVYSISLLTGKGDGSFQKGKPFPFPQYYYISGGNAADLNEDGLDDVIVSVAGRVAVLLARSDGTFQRPVLYPLPHVPGNVVSADFNGDSHQDIAVIDDIPDTTYLPLYVGLGDGSGRLQRYSTYILPSHANSIVAGDFNEDGNPDLAFASDKDTEGVGVLLGNGDGSFYPAGLYPNGGGARWVSVGDFNADGHSDIMFLTDRSAKVLLGHGDGTFDAQPLVSALLGSSDFATVADFDHDGVDDIAVTLFPNTLEVLLGDGTGRLTIFGQYQLGNQYNTAGVPVVGDFNGDGFSDIAVPVSGSDVMSVLINSGVQ
ncbi:MAG TPA: VCBS repeat-containing protein [Terriglobales bacterium]|nr:VCBS repeat-containing protein [Terriglobales bacterium]